MNPTDLKTYSDVVTAFLRQRSVTQRKSTLKGNTTHLNAFDVWLKDKGYTGILVSDITKYHINEFSLYLADKTEGRGLDKGTCENYKKSLSLMFGFAKDREWIAEIPMSLFQLPKKGRDCSAMPLQDKQLATLLKDIEQNDYQLFVALMTVYGGFVRPGNELLSKKVGDYDTTRGLIRIDYCDAKTETYRFAPMPPYLVAIYRKYGIEKADRSLYVFGSNHSFDTKPLSENMLRYRFNKYREKHGLSDGVKVYSMKHNSALKFMENGGNVNELMQLVGHKRMSSTQRYVTDKLGVACTRYQQNAVNPLNILP